MRPALVLCTALAVFQPSHAAPVEDGVAALLGKRLFPVVSSMERSGTSSSVRSMLAERDRRLAKCADDAVCKVDASRWSADEIGLVAGTAAARERSEAIRRELTGLNAILDIYGKGGVARYPQIDGPIGKPGSERLAADVAVAALIGEVGRDETVNALDPSIGLALALLDVNNRLDAIAFEPIDGGSMQMHLSAHVRWIGPATLTHRSSCSARGRMIC